MKLVNIILFLLLAFAAGSNAFADSSAEDQLFPQTTTEETETTTQTEQSETALEQAQRILKELQNDPLYFTDGLDEVAVLYALKYSLVGVRSSFEAGLAARAYMDQHGITSDQTDKIYVKIPLYMTTVAAGTGIPLWLRFIPNMIRGGDHALRNVAKFTFRATTKGALWVGAVALPIAGYTAASVAVNSNTEKAKEVVATLNTMIASIDAEIAKY